MSTNPLPVLTCQCTEGAGIPLAEALKVTTLPLLTPMGLGLEVTTGAASVSVTAVSV